MTNPFKPTCGVELHELQILQRQASTRNHGTAITYTTASEQQDRQRQQQADVLAGQDKRRLH